MASSPVTTAKAEQKRKARYTRTVVRAKVTEAVGGESFDYSPDDVHDFTLPHPLLYSDDVATALEKAGNDEEKVARTLLGDQYDDFKAAGGTDRELGLLMIAVNTDTRDALSNGRPTEG